MLPWGGLSCCLSAAALYLLGRSSGRDADILKTATRVSQLKELAKLLDSESILPLVVAISGRVSSETPITCEFSGLRGVVVEETAEQHFLKHNDAGSWIQDSALMLSMSKEVPWYLVRKWGSLSLFLCHMNQWRNQDFTVGMANFVWTLASVMVEATAEERRRRRESRRRRA